MNENEIIFEKYKDILNESIEIISYSDEDPDSDWETAEAAEQAFKKSGINTPRDKQMSHIALQNNIPIGAIYSKFEIQDAEEYGGEEGKKVGVHSFDVGVDPKYQGGTAGYLLVKACIDDAENIANEMSDIPHIMFNYVINPKMAEMLEKLFKYTYFSKGNGYSHMIKYL